MSSRNHSTKPKDLSHQSKSSSREPSRKTPSPATHPIPGTVGKSKDTTSGGHSSLHSSPHNHSPGTGLPHNFPNTNAKFKDHNNAVVPHHSNHVSGTHSGGIKSELVVEATEHSNGSNSKYQWNSQEEYDDSATSSPKEPTHINALPENVLENLFTFLDVSDVRSIVLVCSEWSRVVNDENGDVWRSHCIRRMSRDVLHSELLSTCPTYRSKLRAYFHAWNPQDCSRNIYVKPSGFTIHRNPVAQSTDGARGKIGFNKGRHAWEVIWEGPLGTVAVVGIATQQAEMRAQGYIALLGKDDQSWGWNLVENVLLHNGDSHGNYPLINNAPRYQVGERIRIILDCDDNTLSFEKNYEFLGVAFRGLPQRELLFPAVSAVYGNTEISMVYLGPPLDG